MCALYTNGANRVCGNTNLPKDLTPEQRDDNKATYDDEIHRYTLTPEWILSRYNYDIKRIGDTEMKARLQDIRDLTYELMYFYQPKTNKRIVEYRMANEKEYRNAIIGAMGAMFVYGVRSDGDEVGDQKGLDVKNSRFIPIENLRGRLVETSGQTNRIFRNTELIYEGVYRNYCVSNEDYRSDY